MKSMMLLLVRLIGVTLLLNCNAVAAVRGVRGEKKQGHHHHLQHHRRVQLEGDDGIVVFKETSCSSESEKRNKKCNTKSPSTTPTSYPTQRPSSSPTRNPTQSPSHEPTSPPTESLSPTAKPTEMPSMPPTHLPTSMPSATPSTSHSPSGSPTDLPSVSPTKAPTDQPSISPTNGPTDQPSLVPTASVQPSMSPTDVPSESPTDQPSSTPSLSMQPTPVVYQEIAAQNGTQLSQCVEKPLGYEGEDSVGDYTFQYYLFLPENSTEDAEDVVEDMESKLHAKLARVALTCDYNNDSTDRPFYFVGMSSGNVDTLDEEGCGSTAPVVDGSDCYLIEASIAPDIYYSNRRRRLEQDPQVVAAIIAMFETIFPQLSEENAPSTVVFSGFTNVDLDGDETSDTGSTLDDPDVDLLARGNISNSDDDKRSPLPPMVIGAAGICFVALIVVLVSRRRRRNDAYMRHLEHIDEESIDDGLSLQQYEQEEVTAYRDCILEPEVEEDAALCELDKAMMVHQAVFNEHHDDRNCVSDTCEICQQKRKRPTFVAASPRQVQGGIQADLGVGHYVSPRQQTPSVNDTQLL